MTRTRGISKTDIQRYNIYALTDPINDQVRYVGMTAISIADRLNEHCKAPVKESRRSAWVNSILVSGHRPTVKLLEDHYGTRKEAMALEQKWIAHFKASGSDLVNNVPAVVNIKRIRKKAALEAWEEATGKRPRSN